MRKKRGRANKDVKEKSRKSRNREEKRNCRTREWKAEERMKKES